MNIARLRKVEKFILAEPRRYDQDEKMRKLAKLELDNLGKQAPPCATMHCIAGAANAIEKRKRFGYHTARRFLGLTIDQAYKLFAYVDGNGWPYAFQTAYNQARTLRERAKVAVARIEHFIKTEGRE